MAYDLSWGSKHPGLLIYLVDLSGSMAWDDKIKRVSNTIWNVVDCLTAPCQDNGVYKNRYYLKVIGYNQYTYDLFSGDINDINSWLDAHDNEQFIDIEKEGKPRGLTHMSIAFDKAAEVVRKWICSQNVKGQPIPAPIVINITDGYPEEKGMDEAQSRDKALQAANALKSISVPDGNVLLFNIHIDGVPGTEPEIQFPSSRPEETRKAFLFDASSEMNNTFVERAQRTNLSAVAGSRFMVSNVSNQRTLSRLVVFGSSVSGLTKPNGRSEVSID